MSTTVFLEMRAQLPQIRTETARYLYLFLQSRDIGKDTDEAEELLLETEWFVDSCSHAAEKLTATMSHRFSNKSDIKEAAMILVHKLRDGKE